MARKAQNSSPILRCTFLARRSAKLIANFSATMVTSLPSFSLSLCISLSLSPNVPHAQSPSATSRTISFYISNSFGINLIHFFDFFDEKEERRSLKFDRLLCCFDPLSITPFDSAKKANRSKSATFLATDSVNSAPFKRGETEVQIFWQGKAQNSSPILRCTFLARRSAKLIANFSATMVTSLPSFSLSLCLSLSLSLSPNVPHAQYRKRFRTSYNI